MPERNRGYLREQRLKSIKKRRRLIKGQKYSGRYASYRHKGAYGPADNYSRYDKQQVEDGKQQIKEWENENGRREKEGFDYS